MAKYRHRVFEMYELRDEAIQSLTPRLPRAATEATAPDSWIFAHLEVSRVAGVIQVRFKPPGLLDAAAAAGFREDMVRLAELLGRDSKVLFDFAGVASLSDACLSALTALNRSLQAKGSRMALCGLEPAIRESFFPAG
ncbi:MAG: STAS domain-containing protein [Pirellulaceae bacterium]|jgi:anti-anti-sigma regulatory factor|nr:STAS domain-containing protein [Pirellulaceae bacterium]